MIYFDSNSTNKLIPEVKEHISLLIERNLPMNASALHKYGQSAKVMLESSRNNIKDLLLKNPHEYDLYFTASCTESNNQIIKTFKNNTVLGPHELHRLRYEYLTLDPFPCPSNTLKTESLV